MKLRLTIQSGTLAGKSYDLTDGFITVGRGETCTVRFDPLNERIVSKKHAYIEAKEGEFFLVDNQSSNGTFQNNQKIQIAKLNAGDRVQFGNNGIQATVAIEAEEHLSEPTRLIPSALPPQVRPENRIQHQPIQPIQPVQPFQPPPHHKWQNSIAGLSLPRTPKPVAAAQTGKYIGIAAAIFLVIFLSLIVSLLVFASVGVVAAIGAAVVAFIPAMFYLLPLIWLDRYDPEPLWLLALAFAWGALVAVVVSVVLDSILSLFISDNFATVISAPIIEEGSKGVGLILLLIFFRRYFDDILDGIVFGGVIALGFATVENVLYYGRGIVSGGSDALLALFILRGILSPFAHVTFTAMTGIGCGIARESHTAVVKFTMPIIGYIGAVALHMLWNGMAVYSGKFLRLFGVEAICPIIGFDVRDVGTCGFLIGYVMLQVPLFLILVGFAFYTMRRQNRILREMLAIDATRGLIPPPHLAIATSALRSSAWLAGGIFNGKIAARNRYLRAVGKLGLSYWHIQRATAAQGRTASFQQNPLLRDEVLKWRDKV